jgi:hypothetical protein
MRTFTSATILHLLSRSTGPSDPTCETLETARLEIARFSIDLDDNGRRTWHECLRLHEVRLSMAYAWNL